MPASPPATSARPGAELARAVAVVVVCAALAAVAYAGRAPLAAGVLLAQLVLTLAWLAALDTAGGLGAFVIAALAAVAGDLLLLSQNGAELHRLVGVLGLAVPVVMAHQLARRPRVRVTDSLMGSLSGVLLVACAAAYVGLRAGQTGRDATVTGLAAVAAAVLAGRLVDTVVRRPALTSDGRRGWPGLLASLAAAAGAGEVWGRDVASLGVWVGLRVGLVAAAVAVAADLTVTLAAASLQAAGDDRQRSALPALGILLPVVVAGPACYVAGRILVG